MCLTRITVHSDKFNPVDIMVIDKTDSLGFFYFCIYIPYYEFTVYTL